MMGQGGGERAWRRRRWWVALALLLAGLAWWTLSRDAGHPPPVSENSAPSASAASAGAGAAAPQGVNDPWALLRRAEATKEPVPVEMQKALAWLEPENDAAWCQHAQVQSAQSDEDPTDALTLELARREVLLRWIQVLRQRGDARSLAGADYLQAVDGRGQALQQRAASSQDGRVLALAAHFSCQPEQPVCQALVSRWLQLETGNELALSWQLNLLPPESSEWLAALTRLADAQPDADSQRVWAVLFASLPRTVNAGLRQMAEQSALESLHWAGSGPMSVSWAMVCRKDKRPATAAVCARLAERIWQSEGGSLMEKGLAVMVGKNLRADEFEWAQRYQAVKLVQAAGARGHEAAVANFSAAAPCAGLAARLDWQQSLARDGEWRVFSQLAAQPVLRSPAAIPLIDK